MMSCDMTHNNSTLIQGNRVAGPPIDLKERSIQGGGITLASQIASTGISLVSVVILARLLTPEDYGMVAMVLSITGFVSLFNDLGLSSATIQYRNITEEQVNALFWTNAALGALIMLIIAASAPALAWFYNKSQLIPITLAFSISSLLTGLGTQHGALLTKQMRFGALAVINITALLAGLVVALIMALSGWTYWALVSSSLITNAWSTAGLWIASTFRPTFPSRERGMGELIRFGANIAGFDVVTYLFRNVDNVLIGRVWGAQQLGLYNKAYELMMMPLRNLRIPLNKVAFPAMSQLQNDEQRYRKYFTNYCSILAFTSMPVIAILFICSESIIRVLLGERWSSAAELFAILALGGFIEPVSSLRQTVIISSGQGKRLFRWALYNSAATITAFMCGLPWGAKGVAVAYSTITFLILHPSLLYAFRGTPVRPMDFYRSVAKPCIASVVMSTLYLITVPNLPLLNDGYTLLIAIPYCSIIYISIFCLIPGGKEELSIYLGYGTIFFAKLIKFSPRS